jgi:hypothetical protein
MIGSSADQQREAIAKTPEEELTYAVLVTFGGSEKLDPLIKKFSLYRGSKAEA